MKKISLLLLPLLAIAFFAQAQVTYSTANAEYVNLPADDDLYKAKMWVTNTTNADIELQWRVTQIEKPDTSQGWNSPGMCDWQTCQPFPASSWTTVTLTANNTDTFYVQMERKPNAVTGCSAIEVEFEEAVGGGSNHTTIFEHTSFSNTAGCWPLSTKKFSVDELVTVYPNPTTSFINLTVNDNRVKSIQMSNIIGRQIKRVNIMDTRSKEQQISLNGLPNGLYILQYKNASGKVLGVHRITKR